MTISLITLITIAALVALSALWAAEPKPAYAPGMDPKIMEAMQPGPEHQQLGKVAGSWDVSCSMWMYADAPVMESQGRSVFRTILDGRFLQADFPLSRLFC